MNKIKIVLLLVFTLVLPAFGAPTPEYNPGAGLLEVFKADSPDMIPRLDPVLKVPWMHNLACKPPESGENIWLVRSGYPDAFVVPECAYNLGARPGTKYSFPYVAQITFYYEAKAPGEYTFTTWHGHNNFTLTIGDFLVANLPPGQAVMHGSCKLEKGLYRAVLWLVSDIYSGDLKNDPYFEVLVLAPNTKTAVPVTRDMLFVKSDDLPRPWGGGGRNR